MIFVLPFFILVALGCLPASTKAIARIIRHTKNALGAMTSYNRQEENFSSIQPLVPDLIQTTNQCN